jgi:uncharacterized membrane protein
VSAAVNDSTAIRTSMDYLREGWQAVRPSWRLALAVFWVWALLTNAAALACYVPLLVVGGPLTGGLYLFFAKLLTGRGGEVGDLFLGFRRFGPTTAVYLLATGAFFAVLLGLWAPVVALDAAGLVETEDFEAMPRAAQLVLGPYAVMIFWLAAVTMGMVFTFGMPAALLGDGRGALLGALGLTRRHLRRVVALNVSGGLLVVLSAVAGVLLCLIGLLVLYPLAIAALVVAQLALYRDVAGLPAERLLYTDSIVGGA